MPSNRNRSIRYKDFQHGLVFENFLSKPTTLTEHLDWQLGAMNVNPRVREAAELVIGNLNEEGYLTASDEELMAVAAGEHVALKGEPVHEAVATEAAGEVKAADVAVETRAPQYPFLKSYSVEAEDAEAEAIAAELAAAGVPTGVLSALEASAEDVEVAAQ